MKSTNTIFTTEKQVEHPLTQKSRFGWMPILFMAIVVINLILTLGVLGRIKSIETNSSDIYVQKSDGSVETAEPKSQLHREEEVIKTFVREWLILAYTWNTTDPKLFVRENSINYPLALYSASMALHPEYRQAYLTSVSRKYSQRFSFQNYIAGKDQSYVRVFREPVVEKIEEGLWEVTIIAYRTHSSDGSIVNLKRVLRP